MLEELACIEATPSINYAGWSIFKCLKLLLIICSFVIYIEVFGPGGAILMGNSICLEGVLIQVFDIRFSSLKKPGRSYNL